MFRVILLVSLSPLLHALRMSVSFDENSSEALRPPVGGNAGETFGMKWDGVESFLGFVGWGHSGHTLVGFMMNAHPEIVIANEYSLFLTSGIKSTAESTYTALLTQAIGNCGKKPFQCELYQKPADWPWYGEHVKDNRPKVVGWKAGGRTAQMGFAKLESSLKKLHEVTGKPVKLMLNHRNIYDHLTTMALHDKLGVSASPKYREYNSKVAKGEVQKLNLGKALAKGIGYYTQHAETCRQLLDALKADPNHFGFPVEVLSFGHSDLIKDPRGMLVKMCEFAGVECSEDYLTTISANVSPHDHPTRCIVDGWTDALKEKVKQVADKYEWNKDYTSDCPTPQSSLEQKGVCMPKMTMPNAPSAEEYFNLKAEGTEFVKDTLEDMDIDDEDMTSRDWC